MHPCCESSQSHIKINHEHNKLMPAALLQYSALMASLIYLRVSLTNMAALDHTQLLMKWKISSTPCKQIYKNGVLNCISEPPLTRLKTHKHSRKNPPWRLVGEKSVQSVCASSAGRSQMWTMRSVLDARHFKTSKAFFTWNTLTYCPFLRLWSLTSEQLKHQIGFIKLCHAWLPVHLNIPFG